MEDAGSSPRGALNPDVLRGPRRRGGAGPRTFPGLGGKPRLLSASPSGQHRGAAGSLPLRCPAAVEPCGDEPVPLRCAALPLSRPGRRLMPGTRTAARRGGGGANRPPPTLAAFPSTSKGVGFARGGVLPSITRRQPQRGLLGHVRGAAPTRARRPHDGLTRARGRPRFPLPRGPRWGPVRRCHRPSLSGREGRPGQVEPLPAAGRWLGAGCGGGPRRSAQTAGAGAAARVAAGCVRRLRAGAAEPGGECRELGGVRR